MPARALVLATVLLGACATPPVDDAAARAPAPESTQQCVADPWAHAASVIVTDHGDRLEAEGTRPQLSDFDAPGAWCTAVSSLPDLDGDGVEEVEVSEGCSYGSYGALHLIYLSNNGCTRYAGELVAGELWPSETSTEGLRDLESHWSNGCAGQDFEWTRHTWTGESYAVADTATCSFCEDEPEPQPGANSHPYCQSYAEAQ